MLLFTDEKSGNINTEMKQINDEFEMFLEK